MTNESHEKALEARWKATIHYRTENGLIDVEHGIDELEELHDIVERGPDWNTLDRIEIVLANIIYSDLTVEKSEHHYG